MVSNVNINERKIPGTPIISATYFDDEAKQISYTYAFGYVDEIQKNEKFTARPITSKNLESINKFKSIIDGSRMIVIECIAGGRKELLVSESLVNKIPGIFKKSIRCISFQQEQKNSDIREETVPIDSVSSIGEEDYKKLSEIYENFAKTTIRKLENEELKKSIKPELYSAKFDNFIPETNIHAVSITKKDGKSTNSFLGFLPEEMFNESSPSKQFTLVPISPQNITVLKTNLNAKKIKREFRVVLLEYSNENKIGLCVHNQIFDQINKKFNKKPFPITLQPNNENYSSNSKTLKIDSIVPLEDITYNSYINVYDYLINHSIKTKNNEELAQKTEMLNLSSNK